MKSNQEKFVEVFGKPAFDNIIREIEDPNTLKWFFKPYVSDETPDIVTNNGGKLITDHYSNIDVNKEVEMLIKNRGAISSNANKITNRVKYDHVWYEDYISNFISSNKRTVPFRICDDKSMTPGKTVHALRNRFEKAIAFLGYSDKIKIHRISQNSPSGYIVIENHSVDRTNGRAMIYKHQIYAKHSTAWYDKAVENFYLSGERSKCFKLQDDKSEVPAKSLDSLKYRLAQAAERAGILDEIQVHKYYKGTCNECVMVENVTAIKKFVGSYKLS